jgi:ATP-binding cassette subfamily F protein 3
MQSVNILIQALDQYEGTFVVVSHDRYFVSQIANKIWYIEDEQIKEYPGTYDEYEWWLEERKSNPVDKPETNSQPSSNSNGKLAETVKPADKNGQNRSNGSLNGKTVVNDEERKEWQRALKKATQQADDFEQQIARLEKQKKQLETEMAEPKVVADGRLLQNKTADYKRVGTQLDAFQAQWEEVMLEAEKLEKKLA